MAKDDTFLTQQSAGNFQEASVEWFVINISIYCPHCGLWQQEEFECDNEHWDSSCIECEKPFHVTMPHLRHTE